MDILRSFGLETTLFIAQVVNFLILAVIIRLFLYKPVKKILSERQEKINKGLDDAEQSRLLRERAALDREELLKAARQDVQNIMDTARKTAEDIKQKVVEDSKAESARILAQARADAQAEMEKMEKQVKGMSLELSRRVLTGLLPSLFSGDEQKAVLDRAVTALEKNTHEQGNA